MKQNKGGHPVVPVEKSNNSASGNHLCISNTCLSPCGHQQHVEMSPMNQDLSQHSSDSDHQGGMCFSGNERTQGQEGVPWW